jgi:hypothetical protein
MTFGLSFGLTLITVTWVSTFLGMRQRVRKILIGAFTLACACETVLVTLQTWRGRPSHFNVETPLDALIARALAVGGAVLVVVIVSLTVAAFRPRATRHPSRLLAIRSGFAALLGAQLAGVLMIARGMRLVLRGDAQAAYAAGGFLKPAHAVLMHGIFVLPALAWLLSLLGWPEERQQAVVLAATAGYTLLAGAVTVTSVAELGLGPAGFPTRTLLVIGTVSIVAAGLVTFVRIVRPAGSRRDSLEP